MQQSHRLTTAFFDIRTRNAYCLEENIQSKRDSAEFRKGMKGMKFIYGKNDWSNMDRAEENCYLLTNGMGGFSSLTMVGSNARNDQALLMGVMKAPNVRYHMVTNVREVLNVGEHSYPLFTVRQKEEEKSEKGYRFLNSFTFEHLPVWVFQAEGVEVVKTIAMVQGQNTVGVKYEIISHTDKPVSLDVTPLFQFVPKGSVLSEEQKFYLTESSVESSGIVLYYRTTGEVIPEEAEYVNDLYYSQDERDGREANGLAFRNHTIHMTERENELLYSMNCMACCNASVDAIIREAIRYRRTLEERSVLSDEVARQLVCSANQFVSYRSSTGGKTILAGFPFFEDWGRDTMIAMMGCTIATKQFEDAKSILRTFMKYCRNGLMPNLFPEGGKEPMYNTVDAALLFVEAVYEYVQASGDREFLQEAFPVCEQIIRSYAEGTDFHIAMDADGLISAGGGLEQVTWMDVRFQDILPTPRHGKPVEINAYWYNALMIMDGFCVELGKARALPYRAMAKKARESFQELFWNEEANCLKDVLSGTKADTQIRCNQIWAVSMPFSMLTRKQAEAVVSTVFEKLYTPYGLRSLAPDDPSFHPFYGGTQFDRDMAYHQGTVWAFPLGAYYLAYLRVAQDKKKAAQIVRRQLEPMRACLAEGCIGQIPEIYDGSNPTISKGCFAQAWSVGELLRVYKELESME